jgi:hypothetical protein
VKVEAHRVAHEWIETDVRCAVIADGDQPSELLAVDEAVDLRSGNLRVVVVEDHEVSEE